MATIDEWYRRYRLNTTREFWEFVGYCSFEYWKPVYYHGGVKPVDVFDLDKVLCPELFFSGFIRVVSLRYSHDNEEERNKKGTETATVRESELTELIQSLVFNNNANPELADAIRNNILFDMRDEVGVDILDLITSIINVSQPKDDTVDSLVQFYSDCAQYYDRIVERKVSDGADLKFAEEFREWLSDWSRRERNGYCNCEHLLSFCIRYIRDSLKKESYSEEAGRRISLADLTDKYVNLRERISTDVICQDTAVRKFLQGLYNGEFKKENKDAPEAVFLFVGPPGVGKTYLAKTAAKYLNRPSKTFHMSEYAHESSFHGLVGFEKTWKNSKPGDLTDYVAENPNAILIFDEIEKAHVNTIRLFLPILEGGAALDLYSQNEVDFRNTIVIFTTNAGRGFYEKKRGIAVSSLSEATLTDALGNEKYNDSDAKMPTEILSRMAKGCIIGFDHMTPAKLVPVIKKGLDKGAQSVEKTLGIKCLYDETILPYIFLYHMGAKLDARVASSRSRSFIVDSVYQLSEQLADNKKELKQIKGKDSDIRIRFTVGEENLARELTVPAQQPKMLIVCNQEDYNNLVVRRSADYRLYHVYAEKDANDPRNYIMQQIKDHEIDAILIDPYMRIKRTRSKNGKKDNLSGISHVESRGLDVLKWILQQNGMPPVYCMELRKTHPIGFTDRQDLMAMGVKDILRFSELRNITERTALIKELSYELFLGNKLDEIISKGKTVSFEIGHAITTSEENEKKYQNIELRINNLKLVRSMDAEAQEIFIDDEARAEGGFDSVIGAKAAKEEMRHFVQFIKEPKRYRKSGRQVSKGMLMYGPAGTGKTMLARALACEADCPFISATGSQFVNGTKSVSELFSLARKYSPSIIFIDEIEAIAQNIGNPILKELLTEMDGFSGRDKPVFVIAATNAGDAPDLGKQNIYLDPALIRRFTKKVYMKWPTKAERKEFLAREQKKLSGNDYHLNNLTKDDMESFADLTAGRSLAELGNILNLAIGRAAENDEQVTLSLLVTCFEETLYGEVHNYSPEHLKITAIHEAGHAFLGFVCDAGKNSRFMPEYATIISRGGYVGMVRRKIDDTLTGYSKSELLQLIRIMLAGRAAEMVFAKSEDEGLTTGAVEDIKSATDVARGLLSYYGMESEFFAAVPADMMMQSPLAERYYGKLNEILSRELDATVEIIKENRKKVEKLANALFDRSRLDTKEMKELLK
ncbi:MAG: AAA family ATPase [Lachnospiraceae bacterium]|nr:AAA family ATPase [Lachnospiraceae bacterium]